ncbi:hypothetical protein [Bartonella heixiaziensis]|uniref:hypothetical protein n=1 Tax=Bartonella heixiaziensis TaxID=1461000 RepID=UPI003D250073
MPLGVKTRKCSSFCNLCCSLCSRKKLSVGVCADAVKILKKLNNKIKKTKTLNKQSWFNIIKNIIDWLHAFVFHEKLPKENLVMTKHPFKMEKMTASISSSL